MKIFQQDVLNTQIEKICAQNKASWFKKLFYSFMGGVFIGLGYAGYLFVFTLLKKNSEGAAFVVASLIFPIGMMMCLFLGGYLFSSNALLILAVLRKKMKWSQFIINMVIVFFMNALGCITIAAIVLATPLFREDISPGVIEIIKNVKVNMEWWKIFLSAILCNLLVCGAVFVFYGIQSKALGTFIVYIMIFLFVISGHNHIVANFFGIAEAGFLSDVANQPWSANEIGKIFYNNLIPTTIGNTFGGMFIGIGYFLCEVKFKNDKK